MDILLYITKKESIHPSIPASSFAGHVTSLAAAIYRSSGHFSNFVAHIWFCATLTLPSLSGFQIILVTHLH